MAALRRTPQGFSLGVHQVLSWMRPASNRQPNSPPGSPECRCGPSLPHRYAAADRRPNHCWPLSPTVVRSPSSRVLWSADTGNGPASRCVNSAKTGCGVRSSNNPQPSVFPVANRWRRCPLGQRIVVDPASISIIRYTAARPYVITANSTTIDLAALLTPPPKKARGRRPKTSDDAAVGGGLGAAEVTD